jgi:hypothetical protein
MIDISERNEEGQEHMSFVFTFGTSHTDPVTKLPLVQAYVELPGDIEQSRRLAFHLYGRNWASQYPSREAAGVDVYNLEPVVYPFKVTQKEEAECGCLVIGIQSTPNLREQEYFLLETGCHELHAPAFVI